MALLAIALPVSSLMGCRSGRGGGGGDVAVLEPVPDATPRPEPPPPAPVLTPPPPVFLSALELADRAFDAGDHQAALAGYRSHLDGDPAGVAADRTLYRLGILLLANGGPGRDATTGYGLLRRLVREHPESPYRMEADLILGLNARVDGLESEIERLESQLEALKRIDLERTPARHPP